MEKKLSFYLKYLRKHEIIVTGLLFIIPVVADEIFYVGAGAVGIYQERHLLLLQFLS
jgi:hypothetical protein